MNNCNRCGSYAINHKSHGRDGSDGHLCDVCYWRKRAEEGDAAAKSWRKACIKACEIGITSGLSGNSFLGTALKICANRTKARGAIDVSQ